MLSLALALLAAAPPATLEIRPAQAKPGDAFLVEVAGPVAEPTAAVLGRPVRFWRTAEGWRGIAGLPAEQPPGPLVVGARAGGAALDGSLLVLDPAFRSRELSV